MGFWRVSCGCLEGVLWVSGGSIVVVWRLLFRSLDDVWRVSVGCLEGVKKEPCGYTGCHSTMGSQFKY